MIKMDKIIAVYLFFTLLLIGFMLGTMVYRAAVCDEARETYVTLKHCEL